MFRCITCFLSIFLILTGLFFIFYLISAKREMTDEGFFVAVEGFEENTRLSLQVYSAYIQANMMNFSLKRPVYVIDHNLKDSTKQALKESLEPYGKVVFIKSADEDKLFF